MSTALAVFRFGMGAAFVLFGLLGIFVGLGVAEDAAENERWVWAFVGFVVLAFALISIILGAQVVLVR